MTQEELCAVLKQLDIPVAYHHFKEGIVSGPPFLCYLRTGSEPVLADNRVYSQAQNYDVELYTEEKSPELEERLEKLFDEHEIVYQTEEVYIEKEDMYEVIYTIWI